MSQRLAPTVLLFAFALAAQDKPAAAQQPEAKTPAHELLASFVGTWRVETTMAAMPGVPGMEKPSEWKGIERAELICDGLWLKVTEESSSGGMTSHGMWLLGYDPFAKTYQCLAVTDMDAPVCCVEATYDAATKTWDFHGDTPQGHMHSVFVQAGDRSEETCYGSEKGGEEKQFMHAVRTRVKDAPPPQEGAKAAEPTPSPELAVLLADCGTWEGEVSMQMGGAGALKAKCRDVVTTVCGGRFTWSDHTGSLMGTPYEGHVLTGYDSKSKQYVAIWIDSTNGAFLRTEGPYDEKTKTMTQRGTTYDPSGNRAKVMMTSTKPDQDTRQVRMRFGEGKRPLVLATDYHRAAK